MRDVSVDQLAWNPTSGTYSLDIPAACFPNSVIPQDGSATFTPNRFSVGIVALVNESQVAFTVFVKE